MGVLFFPPCIHPSHPLSHLHTPPLAVRQARQAPVRVDAQQRHQALSPGRVHTRDTRHQVARRQVSGTRDAIPSARDVFPPGGAQVRQLPTGSQGRVMEGRAAQDADGVRVDHGVAGQELQEGGLACEWGRMRGWWWVVSREGATTRERAESQCKKAFFDPRRAIPSPAPFAPTSRQVAPRGSDIDMEDRTGVAAPG